MVSCDGLNLVLSTVCPCVSSDEKSVNAQNHAGVNVSSDFGSVRVGNVINCQMFQSYSTVSKGYRVLNHKCINSSTG